MSFAPFQFQFRVPAFDVGLQRRTRRTASTREQLSAFWKTIRTRHPPWVEAALLAGGNAPNPLQQIARPRGGAPQPEDAAPGASNTPDQPDPIAAAPVLPAITSGDDPAEDDEDKKLGFRERLKAVLKSGMSKKSPCVACDEPVKSTNLVSGGCEHQYCRPCIREMVKVAFLDRSMFPVRCCGQEIPAKQLVPALHLRVRKVYMALASERTTPPAERWYCPAANCRTWISPRFLHPGSKTQKCPYCRAVICSTCRDLAHGRQQCTEDPGLGAILDVARTQQWQRCYRCHSLVERRGGCPHIRCNCGAEFCYVCGAIWGTCHCWQAAEVLDDHPVWGGEGGPDRAMVVAALQVADDGPAGAVHADA